MKRRAVRLLLVAGLGLGAAQVAAHAAGTPVDTTTTATTTTTTSEAVTVTRVKPRGSIVTSQKFAIVVHADAPGAGPIRLGCDGCTGWYHDRTASEDSNGNYRFSVSAPKNGFAATFTPHFVGSDDALLRIKLAIEPPVAVIQRGNARPGCSVCLVRDPAGDNRGGSPDIASASSSYKGGWVTFTVTTYGSVRSGWPPCIVGWIPKGTHTTPFNICRLPKPSQMPARISYPNSHTVVYRVKPSAFGGAKAFTWQVWVLYPGDSLRDTVPNASYLGNDPRNCFMVEQLRPGRPDDYVFDKNPCSQQGASSHFAVKP